jgi:hypothetical protein
MSTDRHLGGLIPTTGATGICPLRNQLWIVCRVTPKRLATLDKFRSGEEGGEASNMPIGLKRVGRRCQSPFTFFSFFLLTPARLPV